MKGHTPSPHQKLKISFSQLKDPSLLFLSFFGSGLAPFAPGTFGTLATLPFLVALDYFAIVNKWQIAILLFNLTLFSCALTEKVQKRLNLHDPSWIVIDEVLGMTTAWLFISSQTFEQQIIDLLLMFALFRAFDIFKVWPATYFDKQITHGAGTILDDIVSGIYAGISFWLLKFLFSLSQNFFLT